MSLRSLLYLAARLLGDASAVANGRSAERVARRVAGRYASRALRQMFR